VIALATPLLCMLLNAYIIYELSSALVFLIVYFMRNNRLYSSAKMKLTVFFGKNACFGSMIMLLVLQSLLRSNFLLFCICLIPEPLMIINIIFQRLRNNTD